MCPLQVSTFSLNMIIESLQIEGSERLIKIRCSTTFLLGVHVQYYIIVLEDLQRKCIIYYCDFCMHDGSSFVIILGHQVASNANDTTRIRISEKLTRFLI